MRMGGLLLRTQSLFWVALYSSLMSRSVQCQPLREGFDGTSQYVAGEVLVKVRTSAAASALQQITVDTDANVSAEVAHVSGGSIRRIRSRSKSTNELLSILRADPNVAYAEPNFIVHSTTNDPDFGELWGLKNTGQSISGIAGTAGADIEAELAWGVSTGTPTVVVGVVDSGIDYTHPDLAANVWSNPGGVGGCPAGTHGYNALTGTCDPRDDYFHGTHVSGTIGAAGNNGRGVVGVNWTTSIMALKFLDSAGYGTIYDAILAIDFAVKAKSDNHVNVRVLNNSWGGGPFTQALLDEIKKANDNDILFVVSAGNFGANNDKTPTYPASYDVPNVIAVAATDNRDALALFSNYGVGSVHLGAPGKDVLSTIPGGIYEYASGTSMAAPHVSGVAALALSRAMLTTAQLKARILSGVDGVQSLVGKTVTGGRLNACKAVPGCFRKLSVASSPISGVKIEVNQSAELATPFSLTYTSTTVVTLIATTPVVSGGVTYTFTSWTGCDRPSGTTCAMTMDDDKSVTANYAQQRTLTVNSFTPASGVTITVNDASGQWIGTTSFTRTYADNAPVSLIAPDPLADTSTFNGWTNCDTRSSTTCNVTMTADKTVTVTYLPPRAPVIKPSRLNLRDVRIVGPRSTTATVELTAAAPAGGATVTLKSSSLPAGVGTVPPSVLVPAGATVSPAFTVATTTVTTSTAVTITASNPDGSTSATLYVDPIPYEGYLDGADCSNIWGWAWDASLPNTPINVDLYNGTSYIGTVPANAFRQDLLNAAKGNGYHAFSMPLQQPLKDGVAHSIVAKYGGTATLLAGTPKTITCAPPTVGIYWVYPSEATWGPPATLTVAGYAKSGSGGPQMFWRDITANPYGAFNAVAYIPTMDANGVWYNTIPSSNKCHTYEVKATYSGVNSAVFTWVGSTSGYCVSTIQVTSATYGLNCGAPAGNATWSVVPTCNGLTSCSYTVRYQTLGDPAPGCAKDFRASWTCSGGTSPSPVYAAPEAGFGSVVTLSCP